MVKELRAEEITRVLKEELSGFHMSADLYEVGRVISAGDGIARIYGLSHAMLGELVEFEIAALKRKPLTGIVLNLEQDIVGVAVLGDENYVKEGDLVRRTKKVASVPVGDSLLGRIVDALGNAIDGNADIAVQGIRPIEVKAPGIIERKNVHEPLQTGIKVIDALTPIGRGQRELIIGDRKTGKTALAIDAIINQRGENVHCFYVAIGQKRSTVAQVHTTLKKYGAMGYTTIVAATLTTENF